VVLGGLGNILGSLVGAYILGFLSTITAFLISPAVSELPGLVLLVLVLYIRPQGLFGRR
jgi:branched-chain amino acid transport system permease protein